MHHAQLWFLSLNHLVLVCEVADDFLLHVMAHLLLFGGVGVLPHGPDGAREQVVHGLNRPALELGHAEVDKDEANVGQHRVQKKRSPAQIGHHERSGLGDAVVDDPVDEEAEAHGERADSGGENLGRHHVGSDGPAKRPESSCQRFVVHILGSKFSPSKSVDVDPDDTNNTTSWCSTSRVGVGKLDVECNVQHGRCLQDSSNLCRN